MSNYQNTVRLRLISWLFTLLMLAGCGQSPDGPPSVRKQTQAPGSSDAARSSDVSRRSDVGPIDRHIGHLILTRHARCRMDCRHITEKEIREVLEGGEINYHKSEPNAHPDPKYALEGFTMEGQHLRIIFAVPSGRDGSDNSLVVVTCIELGVEWQCDCH